MQRKDMRISPFQQGASAFMNFQSPEPRLIITQSIYCCWGPRTEVPSPFSGPSSVRVLP